MNPRYLVIVTTSSREGESMRTLSYSSFAAAVRDTARPSFFARKGKPNEVVNIRVERIS